MGVEAVEMQKYADLPKTSFEKYLCGINFCLSLHSQLRDGSVA